MAERLNYSLSFRAAPGCGDVNLSSGFVELKDVDGFRYRSMMATLNIPQHPLVSEFLS